MVRLAAPLLAALASPAAGHGMLTRPAARNVLLDMGLTNPGRGECDITEANSMNMNGCQGGAGPFSYLSCWNSCAGDLSSPAPACADCKQEVVAAAEAHQDLRPEPRVGVCGDLPERGSFTNPDTADCAGASCVEQALAKPFDAIEVDPADRSFEVSLTLTVHHYGWMEFRLCRQGGRGESGHGVTQECFNRDLLEFDAADARQRYGDRMGPGVDDPSDYVGTSASVRCDGPGAELKQEAPQIWSPPGTCCYGGGDCGDSNVSKAQRVRFVVPTFAAGPDYKLRLRLPPGLSCTQNAPCTLQWTYVTGNSVDAYPEVFRNCADFRLLGAEGAPAAAPDSSIAHGTSPTAAPLGPTAAPTPAAAPRRHLRQQ